MNRRASISLGLVLIVALSGCGSGGGGTPAAPGPDPPAQSSNLGPFVIHTAAATPVTIKPISNDIGATFTAVYGGPMDYIGVEELLDRIVFSSFRTNANWDVWVCDLFGENLQKVNGTGWPDRYPTWSPDGTKIAFAQERDGQGQADIYAMDSTGGNLTNLTNSTDYDTHPTWSPSGDRIAFETDRAGNWEIYSIYVDGTGATNLTNNTSQDTDPDWEPPGGNGRIAFATSRDGPDWELYTMSQDGSDPKRITDNNVWVTNPGWSLQGHLLGYGAFYNGVGTDIHQITIGGDDRGALADSAHYEDDPCYSHDGRFVAYTSEKGGGFNIWVRPLDPPGPAVRVTDGAGSDSYPDLGNPTVQTARVLIGTTGSDHGFDPVHAHAIATVLVHNYRGYVNFIRLGIKPTDLPTLQVTPLEGTGSGLVGVIWSATDMYYVEQDAGLGAEPTLWDWPGVARSVVLYLNAETGKLVSVLDLDDSLSTAAAHDALSHEPTATGATVRGDFRAVYGPGGELVAEGEIGAVEIDADRGVVRAY